MKILVFGSGLMGPAAVFDAMRDPDVSRVVVADLNQAQLDSCLRKLANQTGVEKVFPVRLDLSDQVAAVKLLTECDAAVSAVPPPASTFAIRTALQARKPLVDFSWPLSELDALRREAEAAAGLVIYCCGVEPGLTEIMARYLAEKMDRVDELHIKCGGIPAEPTPPLGYKIVYGGNRLPLYDTDPFCVEDGKLKQVPRYSGVEAVMFSSVGELEAWHEGFMPWLLEISALKNLQHGTQKTVRWPGYAAKATVLKELGLLGEKPVTVDGVPVAPKHVVDVVLLPHVKMEPTDRDITVVRVEVIGEKDGRACRWKIELVDRYDETTGLHSMARVTAFPASIVARMIARGELKATGLLTPEKVIAGRLFSRLVEELAAHDVRFTLDTGAGARPLM